jgi:prevent-host-death family protein
MTMSKVQIGKLRDRVSYYVRRAAHGESIVVVNRNRDVAILGPMPSARRQHRGLYGCLRGTARVAGDLVDTRLPPSDWFRSDAGS